MKVFKWSASRPSISRGGGEYFTLIITAKTDEEAMLLAKPILEKAGWFKKTWYGCQYKVYTEETAVICHREQ